MAKPYPTRELFAVSFWAKTAKVPSGCWLWTGALDAKGYGSCWINKFTTSTRAHRVAYMLTNGEIAPSQPLDHLCRNRACVNPAHLEIVDNRTNALRGVGITAMNAAKTHCLRGHEFNDINTKGTIMRNGRIGRICRPCRRIRARLLAGAR